MEQWLNKQRQCQQTAGIHTTYLLYYLLKFTTNHSKVNKLQPRILNKTLRFASNSKYTEIFDQGSTHKHKRIPGRRHAQLCLVSSVPLPFLRLLLHKFRKNSISAVIITLPTLKNPLRRCRSHRSDAVCRCAVTADPQQIRSYPIFAVLTLVDNQSAFWSLVHNGTTERRFQQFPGMCSRTTWSRPRPRPEVFEAKARDLRGQGQGQKIKT